MFSYALVVVAILTFISKSVYGQSVTILAGTGNSGNSGDNGPATSADLGQISGTWVDSNGATFFVDTTADMIRRVGTDGIITTVGGTGTSSISNAGGAFTSVALFNSWGIIGDSTFLYISDAYHIWKYERSSGIVSIFAGTGTKGTAGNGGPATSAEVNQPNGLWLNSDNSLYTVESGNSLIRKIDLSTNIISTVAGGGGNGFGGDGGPAISTNTKFAIPRGLYIDTNGVIFIADRQNSRIRYIVNGIIDTYAGGGPSSNTADGFVGTNAYLTTSSTDLKGDTMGNIYLVDSLRVKIVDYATKGVTTYISSGLSTPRGLWLDFLNGRMVIGTARYVKTAPLSINPMAFPTTAPTTVLSQVPTTNPSFSPSALPSREPSSVLSDQPTLSPTVETFIPTRAPSFSPTVHTQVPSESPTHGATIIPTTVLSQVPTTNPSFSPSALPSREPSSVLSDQPTFSPTVETFIPTRAPSFSPPAKNIDVVQVSATSRVKVVYGQALNQVSLETLVSAFQNISDNAQSTAIISTVLAGQSSPQSVRRGLMASMSVSGQLSYIYDIGFLSNYEMPYHAGYTSSQLAVLKTTKVRQAIEVGQFESVLRNLAVVRNATQLLNASSSEVRSLDSVIVPASSSSSKDDDNLSIGTVAGIVVGVLGGCFCIPIIWFVLLKRRDQKITAETKETII